MPPRVIDHDTLRATTTALRDASWEWTADEAPALMNTLGWRILESFGEDGLVATAGLGVGKDEVDVPFRRGKVDRITLRLTDVVLNPTPDDAAALQDAFASVAVTLTDVLGTPTEQSPGEQPSIRWRGPSATLETIRTPNAVSLSWASNHFQDILDRLEE